MNCKQGDLAVVVVSTCGNEGKIVRCVEYAGEQLIERPDNSTCITACWKTEPCLPDWDGGVSEFAADYQLRPIRDQDGEDETLAWAGKPKEVAA